LAAENVVARPAEEFVQEIIETRFEELAEEPAAKVMSSAAHNHALVPKMAS
jgi:hypothetical protein